MCTTLLLTFCLFGSCFTDTNLAILGDAIDFITNQTLLKVVFEPDFLTRSVDIILYTKNNSSGFPIAEKCSNVKFSDFSAKRPTKVIIHGWTDSAFSPWVQSIRETYLTSGDFNVICLDWYPDSLRDYWISARLTQQVGIKLANALKCLRTQANLELADVHLIGHSLGAQIASFAAKKLPEKSVGRITGLDPARPSFESFMISSPGDHLIWTDANFVDVIHTCAGTLGFQASIGHADFYPNRGMAPQPGCPLWNAQTCSHTRSYEYMIESILSPLAFPALECGSFIDYKLGKCKKNRIATMGEPANVNSRGIFFLETNSNSPYGKGSV